MQRRQVSAHAVRSSPRASVTRCPSMPNKTALAASAHHHRISNDFIIHTCDGHCRREGGIGKRTNPRGKTAHPPQHQHSEHHPHHRAQRTEFHPQLEKLVVRINPRRTDIDIMRQLVGVDRQALRTQQAPAQHRALQHTRGHVVPDLQAVHAGRFEQRCQLVPPRGEQAQRQWQNQAIRDRRPGERNRRKPRRNPCHNQHEQTSGHGNPCREAQGHRQNHRNGQSQDTNRPPSPAPPDMREQWPYDEHQVIEPPIVFCRRAYARLRADRHLQRITQRHIQARHGNADHGRNQQHTKHRLRHAGPVVAPGANHQQRHQDAGQPQRTAHAVARRNRPRHTGPAQQQEHTSQSSKRPVDRRHPAAGTPSGQQPHHRQADDHR